MFKVFKATFSLVVVAMILCILCALKTFGIALFYFDSQITKRTKSILKKYLTFFRLKYIIKNNNNNLKQINFTISFMKMPQA